MNVKKRLAAFLCVMLILALMGCSERSADAAYSKGEIHYVTESDAVYDRENGISYGGNLEAPSEGKGGSGAVVNQNQKLVRTMRIHAQTQEMEPLLALLENKIRQLGGYVENKNIQNYITSGSRTTRNAELTVRIPAQSLDEFVDHIYGQSNVTSLSETVDDITLKYIAVESRITALETEQQRLLELLEKAESMADLLQIEARLTEVRTELEQVVSQLRIFDNMVDYATVHLSVTEVRAYTEPEDEKSVWQRIGAGLSENWDDIATFATDAFVFIISSLPILVPLGGAVVVVILVARKRRKKAASQPPVPPAFPEENQYPEE